jgi:S1-C subfamily serine protease
MLTRNTYKSLASVLSGMLLFGQPALGLAGGSRQAPVAEDEGVTSPGRQSIGAPQVLEIPPVQDSMPSSTERSSPTTSSSSAERPIDPSSEGSARSLGARDLLGERERLESSQPMPSSERRNYLGVLYATAEDGPTGVKVLDVIPGSPAARAGFEGANAPKSTPSNDFVKIALVALTMSPVGPFAMPLLIAHNMYSANHQASAGDVIVAIGDRQVRDAVEFSQEMHRYQPGDTVTFSILRQGKSLQLPALLEEEPS